MREFFYFLICMFFSNSTLMNICNYYGLDQISKLKKSLQESNKEKHPKKHPNPDVKISQDQIRADILTELDIRINQSECMGKQEIVELHDNLNELKLKLKAEENMTKKFIKMTTNNVLKRSSKNIQFEIKKVSENIMKYIF